jgi:hypothetical protein
MKCYAIHKYLTTLSLLKIAKLPRKRMAASDVNSHFLIFLLFCNGRLFITFFPVHHIKRILNQELFSVSENEKERFRNVLKTVKNCESELRVLLKEQ